MTVDKEQVKKALIAMGYDPDEIEETAKAEVESLLEVASKLNEAMTVNLEDECPDIPD